MLSRLTYIFFVTQSRPNALFDFYILLQECRECEAGLIPLFLIFLFMYNFLIAILANNREHNKEKIRLNDTDPLRARVRNDSS